MVGPFLLAVITATRGSRRHVVPRPKQFARFSSPPARVRWERLFLRGSGAGGPYLERPWGFCTKQEGERGGLAVAMQPVGGRRNFARGADP